MGIVFIDDGGPIVITHRDTATSTANSDTYTSAGVSFGLEAADRYIVVGFVYFGATTPNNSLACTIGGVSATRLVRQTIFSGGTGLAGVAFYAAPVPTGTTGTIVHTLTGTAQAAGCVVYRVTGWAGASVNTTADDSDPVDMTITRPANSGVIAVATAVNDFTSDPGVSAVWTGLTQDEDTNFESSTVGISSASNVFTTQDSSFDVECALVHTSGLQIGAMIALYN